MNNKGQTLIIFVLILPILLLLIALIWEIGNLQITKSQYEIAIKDTIEYGLNHQDQKNLNITLENLLKASTEGNIKIEIKNYIKITVTKPYEGLYNNLFNHKFDIKLTYIGYKENNQIIIKKEIEG